MQIHQDKKSYSYYYDQGTKKKDRFYQGGKENTNIAVDKGGGDEFIMNGIGCDNRAYGGKGDNIFQIMYGCYNLNEVFGGEGIDTVNFCGKQDDYNISKMKSLSDPHYEITHKSTGSKTIIRDCEIIKFQYSGLLDMSPKPRY
ncbi:MAG: hypothetical protein AB1782_11910 [Cyanobacteriota bacterium]